MYICIRCIQLYICIRWLIYIVPRSGMGINPTDKRANQKSELCMDVVDLERLISISIVDTSYLTDPWTIINSLQDITLTGIVLIRRSLLKTEINASSKHWFKLIYVQCFYFVPLSITPILPPTIIFSRSTFDFIITLIVFFSTHFY